MQHTLQAQLGNNIKLLGYDLDVIQNSRIQITLYWQPGSRILNSYTVFVHYVDSEGRLWAQHDGLPVNAALPTDLRISGEIVEDKHTLNIPEDLPPGEYTLRVGIARKCRL